MHLTGSCEHKQNPVDTGSQVPHIVTVTDQYLLPAAAACIYALDILAGFHVAFVVRYDVRRQLVMDGYKVARYYICYGPFWVDFLACR